MIDEVVDLDSMMQEVFFFVLLDYQFFVLWDLVEWVCGYVEVVSFVNICKVYVVDWKYFVGWC